MVVVHVVMKESLSACASEKAGTAKARSKTTPCTMRLFLPRRANDSFSGAVPSTSQNHPVCRLAGDPNRWRAAAGMMQDGLSGTAEPKNALLTSGIPSVPAVPVFPFAQATRVQAGGAGRA